MPRPTSSFALRTVLALTCALTGCTGSGLPRIDPSGESLFIYPNEVPPPAVAAPPGMVPAPITGGPIPVGAPALALPPQPGISVTPSRVVAPVGSEVVMIASVTGAQGRLSGERVEWMLEPGGTGQFVALPERGAFDCLDYFRGLPKKVNNTFAVNSTASSPMRLDRGTPTPIDDVVVDRGQAWLTVTSPAEGVSHVTAYGPQINGWDRRQQTATIYWVDAQWAFPPPAINPVGSRHTFTTTVSRQTDGSPLGDYRVRYEITGGPDAGFAPDGSSSVEVPTNELGQASVEIFQKQPVAGTNQIAIEVIRPAGSTPSGRRLTLGTGGTLKTWTSSQISIRTTGPAQAAVGSTVTYRIEVTNPGTAAARDLVIASQVPLGLSFLNSNPAANSSPSGQEWRVSELGPQQSSVIEANFRVDRPGNFNFCASVSGADGQSARDCATTNAGASQLELRLTGPDEVPLGAEVTFGVEIVNRSDRPMTGLTLTDRFDAGLVHAQASSPIQRELADLPAGGSRSVGVTFRATQAGKLCHTVTVAAAGGMQTSGQACVNVVAGAAQPPANQPPVVVTPPATNPPGTRQPSMKVTKTGPKRQRVGETAEFIIEVTNTGTVPLTNLRIADNYELSLEPTEATEGFVAAGSGSINWTVDELQPGKSIRRQINCRCTQAVSQACNRVTVTAEPALTMADQACLEVIAGEGGAATDAPQRAETRPNPATPGRLSLSVADLTDPVKVDSETTYQILLKNESSSSDRNVVLTVRVPPEMTLRVLGGPVKAKVLSDRSVKFDPIAELRAGESISFDVTLKARTEGTAVLQAEATSQRQTDPVKDEETTQVISN